MISELAKVFSSQGVVVPSTQYVPDPQGGEDSPVQAVPANREFTVRFEQAAAKLELSSRALRAAEEADKKRTATGEDLSPEEQKTVEKLEERDAEVRRHEQAHIAAAAGNTRGGPKFEYQVGPDKKRYAVGGHVDIDMSPVSGNPEATLQKAQAIKRSATAPGDPSGADQAVAAQAARMAQDAAKQVAQERSGKMEAGNGAAARRNPYAEAASRGAQAAPGRFVNAYA